MDQLEQLLQARLNLASSELAVAQKQLTVAQGKVDSLTRRVDAFTRALAEEKGEKAPEDQEPRSEPSPTNDNKSQIFRDLVESNAQIGTTIKDVTAAFLKAGVSFHPNYPYAVKRRLQKTGVIKEVRGKLYPVKTETTS